MTLAKFSVFAAVCVPVLLLGAPTFAATAHNLETTAHTKNAQDTAMDANMKQMHMKRKRHHRSM